jgi:hypothetical protein
MTENRIRCTVTRYSVVDDRLVETTTEERRATTSPKVLRRLPLPCATPRPPRA